LLTEDEMRTGALKLAAMIDRRRWTILVVSFVLAIGGGVLASKLPVYGDFIHLLPPSAPSVVQLRELQGRIESLGAMMVLVESNDPKVRARAHADVVGRLKTIDPTLIASISWQNRETRDYIWNNRFLYAPLADLEQARSALEERVKQAKLKANPLYVDLEDEPAPDGRTDKLEQKLRDAQAEHDRPPEFISRDGKMGLVVVRATFDSSAIAQASRLVDAVIAAGKATEAAVPGCQVAVTSDVFFSVAEHQALLEGMLLAICITVGLVAAGILLYFRTIRGVGALMWALTVGTVLTFAVTKLTIGHLNLATAFLSSIVVGNGINCGIVLLARHLEERRGGNSGVRAIATAMAGSVRGTLTASLTAAVAYGSLVLTDFKGFRHFGIIGFIGMVLCWVTAYLVLPAGLAVLERSPSFGPRPEPVLGRLLLRLYPKRFGWVVALSVVATVAAGGMTWNYLSSGPWEHNMRKLRSDTGKLDHARDVLARIGDAFGNDITGGFLVAVKDREAARRVVATMRATDANRPKDKVLFSSVKSLDDVLPADQPRKLELLAEIRRLIDDALRGLDEKERKRLLELRPPDGLGALVDMDVPAEIAWPFTERDGTRGRLILADSSSNYDTWNIKSLIKFADDVRALDLGPDVALGGSMFVFADVLRSMEGDGPKATVAATVGAVLIVVLLVGIKRHGLVTLACGLSGTLMMIAAGHLIGLKVNFLDFVALPITIGIGIDYSVNIAAREQVDGPGTALHALATTGGAVTLCSYTTIVGYASLLLSASGGIRSFGAAATVGEITCLVTALLLAPALLALWARVPQRRGSVA
jgi:predicted RND superfamily exporter protein